MAPSCGCRKLDRRGTPRPARRTHPRVGDLGVIEILAPHPHVSPSGDWGSSSNEASARVSHFAISIGCTSTPRSSAGRYAPSASVSHDAMAYCRPLRSSRISSQDSTGRALRRTPRARASRVGCACPAERRRRPGPRVKPTAAPGAGPARASPRAQTALLVLARAPAPARLVALWRPGLEDIPFEELSGVAGAAGGLLGVPTLLGAP
jgi:hypothetical protein